MMFIDGGSCERPAVPGINSRTLPGAQLRRRCKMNPILITILAGFIGTAGMSMILWGITQSGVANAAMIRAIGS